MRCLTVCLLQYMACRLRCTVFNLNQVNTSACCNDDYDECNPHDISVLDVPRGTMRFDTNTKSKTSKKNERTHTHMCPSLKS